MGLGARGNVFNLWGDVSQADSKSSERLLGSEKSVDVPAFIARLEKRYVEICRRHASDVLSFGCVYYFGLWVTGVTVSNQICTCAGCLTE